MRRLEYPRFVKAIALVFCSVAILVMYSLALAVGVPDFALEWGVSGSGPGQFLNPQGIAISSSGAVYVTDNSDRVQKFDRFGNFLLEWGGPGTSDGEFNGPQAIALFGTGGADTLYIVDTFNRRIQKFTGSGSFLLKWGSLGSGPGEFSRPTGIAVDDSEYVYVSDFNTARIQKFTSDGTYVTEWGSFGTGIGQFQEPAYLAIDAAGQIYVAEWTNNRIQKFTSNGTYVGMWGSTGTGDGEFMGSYGLTIACDSVVYVTESNGDRVQAFKTNGTFLCKWGSTGTGPGEFDTPKGIAVTQDGSEVFVVESSNHRVQKFTYIATGIGDLPRQPGLILRSGPNPFIESTTLRYALPEIGSFHLAVYDVQGRRVRILDSGVGTPGDRLASWRGDDDNGSPVASGVYFVRLTTQGHTQTVKLSLIR